jgi:hypothetical protein
MTDVTQILNAIEQGDAKAADELLPLLYEELRLLANASGPCKTRLVPAFKGKNPGIASIAQAPAVQGLDNCIYQ